MERKIYFLLFSSIFVLSYIDCQQNSDPLVRISNGLLSGTWKVSTNGRLFASFQGIPYAAPPVGKNRFRDPVRVKPWTGVWDARRPGSSCLQYDPFIEEPEYRIKGNEDCLYLNVHTPQLTAVGSLPVIVFIHGGAFMFGTGSVFGAENWMDRDVIVVTLNYRLGPLGFLSTQDDLISGNMGLKDQAFALKWVKEHIKDFGGNPDSITITGLSAGGASVHYQYMSPLSKGTFNRGIAFSGSAFSSWTQQVRPLQKAKTLAAHIGCPTETNKAIVDCLRTRPGSSIVYAQTLFFDWNQHWFTVFTPTVESATVKEHFISHHPYLIAKNGLAHKLPFITSVTTEEGLYPAAAYQADPNTLLDLDAHWDQLASSVFVYNDTLPIERRQEVAQKIKMHYLQGNPVNEITYPALVQALGDRLFVSDVGKSAQIHAQTSGQPTYLYEYAFRGEDSLSDLMARKKDNFGVSHGDDVLHLFKFPGIPLENTEDVRMTNLLLDLFCSYAMNGIPQSPGVIWLPVAPGSNVLNFLEIKSPNETQMMTSSDFGFRSFWDSIGFLENENAHILNHKDEL